MIEAIKKELLDNRFTYNESSKSWYYEYSDFEVLSFVIDEHTKVNGDKCIAISDLNISDYINGVMIFNLNYTLYFDNFNNFYELLTLLNYKIY